MISSIDASLYGINHAMRNYEKHTTNISEAFLDRTEQKERNIDSEGVQLEDTAPVNHMEHKSLQNKVEEIDLATEMTGMLSAKHAFEANLKALRQSDEMTKHLLDMIVE